MIKTKCRFVRLFLFCCAFLSLPAHSVELQLREVASVQQKNDIKTHPNQLPQSRVAYANGKITSAWLVNPTDRYRHGVLGDVLEAAGLVVEKKGGDRSYVELPANRVFEDLQPRLVDLDGDGQSEIIVVESDSFKGGVFGCIWHCRRQTRKTCGDPIYWPRKSMA